MNRVLALCAATLLVAGAVLGEEQPGVSDRSILFGQSAAFSGPAQELGRNMRLGMQAAFWEVNEQGGVHGRRLELVSFDDGYEPKSAIDNTRQLIGGEQVFALIGAVGTPTSLAAVPIAEDAGVPYIAPFTGSSFLRDPKWQGVVNMRASYFQETEEIVARLTDSLGVKRIAIMYQDDSFGREGFRGVRRALERRELSLVSVGVYPRNTTAVKTALLDLRGGQPQAVILVGTYEPVATLIAWAQATGFNPIFATISFVGSKALARELGPAGTGVLVSQVVPFPTATDPAIVGSYRSALTAYAPKAEPSFVSFEGYLAGRLAIAALTGCGREVSRACLLENLRRADVINLEGFKLRYGDGDNQGSDAVFLTAIDRDGEYRPIQSLESATKP